MISQVQRKQKAINDRDGINYYSFDGIQFVQQEMMRLLKIINDIAVECNIPYWLSGGSIIGAVRHKGFIPWDDDLDINLIKEDYIRLVNNLTEYCKTHKDVYLAYNSPQNYHCCNYFLSRRFFLRTQGVCSYMPVKVDIRPINCIKGTEYNRTENLRLRDIANYYLYKKSYGYAQKKDFKRKINDFFKWYNYEYGLYDKKALDAEFCMPYFEYANTYKLTYNDIFPLIYLNFENISVPVLNNYDYYLRQIYGDYMKLPAEQNRAPIACEMREIEMSEKEYKRYIYGLFDQKRKKILCRIMSNFFYIRIISLRGFIKARCFETKIHMISDYINELKK